MPPSLNHLECLYDALNSEAGIIVLTEDPERLRQKLYVLRKERIGELGCLSFLISPTNPQSELWILRKPDGQGRSPDETHTEPTEG